MVFSLTISSFLVLYKKLAFYQPHAFDCVTNYVPSCRHSLLYVSRRFSPASGQNILFLAHQHLAQTISSTNVCGFLLRFTPIACSSEFTLWHC